jgi:hypothetical protein
MSHGRLEHFRSEFAQELRTVWLWKVQENLIDTFALGVADCAQAVTRDSTSQPPSEVPHDETESTTTHTTDHGPKP